MKLAEINREMNIYMYSSGIILILIISIVFLMVYFQSDETVSIKYEDDGKVDYTVALKKNEFFEKDYLEKDNQYISELIDSIDAKFNYKFKLSEDLEYNYKYKIVTNVNIIEKETNKAIYKSSVDTIQETVGSSNNIIDINEDLKIDYNKYNDMAKEFTNSYKLTNTTSTLTVKMFMDVEGANGEFVDTNDLNIDIPLTTNTVAVDVKNNIKSGKDEITMKSDDNKNIAALNIAIATFGVDMLFFLLLLKYMKDSLTDEQKYNRDVKKIVNAYGTYISEVEDGFDMQNYKIVKVKTFMDLLEIRDTMHVPIVMIQNKESLVTCFVIPTENNMLYFFSLGVSQYALPESNDDDNDGQDVTGEDTEEDKEKSTDEKTKEMNTVTYENVKIEIEE